MQAIEHAIARLARPEDARGIYEAHMRSIREVCSRDYSAEQIAVWGNRPFQPGLWEDVMAREPVWVVESEGRVLGFAYLRFMDPSRAELATLFLVPEALGQGFGRQLLDLALERARQEGSTRVVLSATRTALPFYLSQGFQRVPGPGQREIGGVQIECFALERPLL